MRNLVEDRSIVIKPETKRSCYRLESLGLSRRNGKKIKRYEDLRRSDFQ